MDKGSCATIQGCSLNQTNECYSLLYQKGGEVFMHQLIWEMNVKGLVILSFVKGCLI